jgi:hypothetical protein
VVFRLLEYKFSIILALLKLMKIDAMIDEFRFLLRFGDGRNRVYRRCGERFTDQCVYESDRFGGGSVMVWVGICHDGRTQLKLFREH